MRKINVLSRSTYFNAFLQRLTGLRMQCVCTRRPIVKQQRKITEFAGELTQIVTIVQRQSDFLTIAGRVI